MEDLIPPCVLHVLVKLEKLIGSIADHYELEPAHKHVLLMASARLSPVRRLVDSVVRYRRGRGADPDDCILARPGLYGVLGMLDENVSLTQKTALPSPLVVLSACLEDVEKELRSIIIDMGSVGSCRNTSLITATLRITLETIRSLRNINKLVVDEKKL